jgi:phospholipid/cholesterol/gamma-HCH transport system permease protein
MLSDPTVNIECVQGPGATVLHVSGDLTISTLGRAQRDIAAAPATGDIVLDLHAVQRLDTAGAWLLVTLKAGREAAGHRVDIEGMRSETESLLASVTPSVPDPVSDPVVQVTVADRIADLGRAVAGGFGYVLALVGYLGLFLSRLARAVRRPGEFRLTSLVHHCEEVGVKALPIVALMAFLIGVVLAFQGAAQLRQFGAEVFVVDLIAVSILRELGILLTSIIVAGRTASAFTAAIGSMKMREEIDAMRTLGLDSAMILFVPRILALFLMLPILGLVANAAGLFGGALMAWIELGISPEMFRTRLIEGGQLSHLTVGLVKAPVFALIIGIVGCHAGMQVKSNAESLGQQTSKAVVAAIFAVIVADAAFSIFFAQIGV